MPGAASKAAQVERHGPRFGEFSKLPPVAAVLAIIAGLTGVYIVLHCLRLLQTDLPPEFRDAESVARGQKHFAVYMSAEVMILYLLVRSILTHPGTVPEGHGWDLLVEASKGEGKENDDERPAEPEAGASGAVEGAPPTPEGTMRERKRTGARRHCKWCLVYKPDRCHHCRICNMCVLRMDHHCCFLYNCIGYRNHKYFFLLLVYGEAALLFIAFTLPETVVWAAGIDVPGMALTVLVVTEVLTVLLSAVMGSFLIFHISLVARGMTTLEHCEKATRNQATAASYTQGLYRNICAVLGPYPFLWLLPVALPHGDGMTFRRAPRS